MKQERHRLEPWELVSAINPSSAGVARTWLGLGCGAQRGLQHFVVREHAQRHGSQARRSGGGRIPCCGCWVVDHDVDAQVGVNDGEAVCPSWPDYTQQMFKCFNLVGLMVTEWLVMVNDAGDQ